MTRAGKRAITDLYNTVQADVDRLNRLAVSRFFHSSVHNGEVFSVSIEKELAPGEHGDVIIEVPTNKNVFLITTWFCLPSGGDNTVILYRSPVYSGDSTSFEPVNLNFASDSTSECNVSVDPAVVSDIGTPILYFLFSTNLGNVVPTQLRRGTNYLMRVTNYHASKTTTMNSRLFLIEKPLTS
jgi:hypothetical protein